jgi:hypothetical protein
MSEADFLKMRDELKNHCYGLIDLISQKKYCLKLLLAAARGLEMVADYKANRSGNHAEKFPLTTEQVKNIESENYV